MQQQKSEEQMEMQVEATQSPTLESGPGPHIETRAPEDCTMDIPSLSPSSPGSKKRKRHDKAVEEIQVDMSAPEPPSKKALRRAKKGKPFSTISPEAPKTSTEAPITDTYLEVDKNGEQPKRSEYGIWIGNLMFSTTKADLRKFFTEHSKITEEQITRIHLPAPAENGQAPRPRVQAQNKGFAYIDFATSAALDEALGLSEKLLTGRRVLIKNSKSFEGRPEKSKGGDELGAIAKGGKPPSKRIFLGNLAFDVTKEDLKEHFTPCGEVVDIHLATFEDSGKCKGFAWLEFENLEAGEAAVRGWVKISEDQDSESEEGGDGNSNKEKDAGKSKAQKTRKWWVNRIKGRSLRMEFAEDKAVRYKKRFGEDGTARKGNVGDATQDADAGGVESGAISSTPAAVIEGAPSEKPTRSRPRPMGNAGIHHQRKVDARTIKPGAALAAAPRMTGAIVEGKGKKITFE